MSNAPQDLRRRHPEVTLRLETGFRTNVFKPAEPFVWREITLAMDGGDTTCQIVASLDKTKLGAAGTIGQEHFAHLIDRVKPDRRVRVEQTFGDRCTVYFQGYPLVPTINWSERNQTLSALCLSEGQEHLRTAEDAQVVGRIRRYDPVSPAGEGQPDPKLVLADPCVFNANGKPNRLRDPLPFKVAGGTHRIHLFTDDNHPDAEPWSYAQALRYLVFGYIESTPQVDVSGMEFLVDTMPFINSGPQPFSRAFNQRMTALVKNVSVASVDVERAIYLLCDAAGLHYEIPVRVSPGGSVEHFLRIFTTVSRAGDSVDTGLRMISPREHDIPREAPFTNMAARTVGDAAAANRAPQANLTIDHRAATKVYYLGGVETYEVTLLLRPGWTPHAMLDDVGSGEGEQGSEARADAIKAAVKFWRDEFEPPFDPDQTRTPNSKYHFLHPEHDSVRNVGRLWIFPDDGAYTTPNGTSPLERKNWPYKFYSPYDADAAGSLVMRRGDIGGGIRSADKWVPKFRPFGELFARSDVLFDRAPRVYFNYKADDPMTALSSPDWVRYGGQVDVDPDRAAIRITEADLWGSPLLNTDPLNIDAGIHMLEALIGLGYDDAGKVTYGDPHFFVAILCTIRGDARLQIRKRARRLASPRLRGRVMDLGEDRFRRHEQGKQSSAVVDPAILAKNIELHDDEKDLERFAQVENAIVGVTTVSGSIDIPWIDDSYRLGDSFTGVRGLGLTFLTSPGLVRIQYSNNPRAGYRTALHLSDLRHAPEVGTE